MEPADLGLLVTLDALLQEGSVTGAARRVGLSTPAMSHALARIVAHPTTSTTTGWPVGFWWSELTHPYHAFTRPATRSRCSARPAARARPTP